MNSRPIFISILISALVISVIAITGLGNTPAFARGQAQGEAQALATTRPTRDRTTNPRNTKTPTPDAPAETDTPEPSSNPRARQPKVAPGAMSSQLLILNSDRNGTAKVTVNVLDVTGTIAFSDTFKIKENGAKLFNLPQSVGKNFLGSARVSANRRVQAIVLNDNKDETASDTYEVSNVTATKLTLPYVHHAPGASDASATIIQNSLIAIQNTALVPADATLDAYDPQGNLVLSHSLTIPSHASAYLNTNDLFGATPFVGSARITGTQRLVAAELATGLKDTASFRASTPKDQDNKLVVPGVELKHRKDGAINAWNQIYVRNNGSAATDVIVDYYNPRGVLKGSIKRANVPSEGLTILDTRDPAFAFLGNKFTGWAQVRAGITAQLAVDSVASRARGRQVSAVGAVARARVNGRGVCADVNIDSTHKSVISVINAHAQEKGIMHIRAYNQSDGALVQESDIEIAPHAQLALSPKNGLPDHFRGFVLLSVQDRTPRSLIALVTTQTFKGKHPTSSSAYMCR